MRRCSLCLIATLFVLVVSSLAFGQARPAPPVGTKVEVLDGAGRLQQAEFVEMTPSGSVRVKMATGETRIFPANRVRVAVVVDKTQPNRLGLETPKPKVEESPEAAAAAAKLAGMRTWTDSTGMFKVEAEFISFKNGELQLKKADGKVLTLSEDKLSASDQEIARYLAARPGQGNPFEAQVDDPGIVLASVAVQPTNVPYDAAPTIDLETPVTWSATTNPAKHLIPLPPNSLKVKRITGSKHDFGRDPKSDALVLDVANQRAWLGVASKVWGYSSNNDNARYRLEIIDFRAGGSLIPIAMPGHLRPESVDPTGKLLLTRKGRPELNDSETSQLDVWQLNGAGLKHARSFVPYVPNGKSAVVWARFLDTAHVLTRNLNNQLILWNVDKQTPVYQTAPGTARTCELSPGGTQVAIGSGRTAYLLEALTGKVLGKFGSKEPEPVQQVKPTETAYDLLRIGFSADGAYVAAASSHAVFAWKVRDGSCLHALSSRLRLVPADETRPCLSFGAYQTLIIDHEYVFDTQQRRTIFNLDGQWKAAAQYQGQEVYVFDEFWDEQMLTSFTLPTERMASRAAIPRTTSLAAIEPGTTVSATFRLPFDEAENAKIKEHLLGQLAPMGLKLAAAGEKGQLELIAQVSVKDEETIFQKPDGSTQNKTGARFTGSVSLGKPGAYPLRNVMTTWGAPGKVFLNSNETPESYPPSVPTPDFFLKARLAADEGEVPTVTYYSLPKDGVFSPWY